MQIVIAGTGLSVQQGHRPPPGVRVLGINSIDYYLVPGDLIVIDPPDRFAEDRQATIRHTSAAEMWAASDEWLDGHNQIACLKHIDLIKIKRWDSNLDEGPLPYFKTSLIPAIVLAWRLGGKDIGVIGCDLIAHEELQPHIQAINRVLKSLARVVSAAGGSISNISPIVGRLTGIPRVPVESWVTTST